MKSRTTLSDAVVFATALTLALTGCTGSNDKPTPTATPTASTSSTGSSSTSASASATPSASPTSSVSASVTIPAAARANTDAGAIAFVKFWFTQMNLAYTKPDATLIPAFSTDDCKSCAALQEDPDSYVKLGQHMDKAPTLAPTNLEVVEGASPGMRFVRLDVKQTEANVLDRKGNVVDSQVAKSLSRVAIVSWEGNQWKLSGLANPS